MISIMSLRQRAKWHREQSKKLIADAKLIERTIGIPNKERKEREERELAKRNADIVMMRADGATYRAIGITHGITPGRCGGIVKRYIRRAKHPKSMRADIADAAADMGVPMKAMAYLRREIMLRGKVL